jgi:hypothetical protein
MLIRRIIAVTLLAALFITITYFCIYSFTMSLEQLGVSKTYAEKDEVLPALMHVITSALYLLFTIFMLVLIGIFMYLIIALLLSSTTSTSLHEYRVN